MLWNLNTEQGYYDCIIAEMKTHTAHDNIDDLKVAEFGMQSYQIQIESERPQFLLPSSSRSDRCETWTQSKIETQHIEHIYLAL